MPCRPCSSEVTLWLPVDGAQRQSLSALGQQVALVEAVHSVLLVMHVVGDVLEVLEVGPGQKNVSGERGWSSEAQQDGNHPSHFPWLVASYPLSSGLFCPVPPAPILIAQEGYQCLVQDPVSHTTANICF